MLELFRALARNLMEPPKRHEMPAKASAIDAKDTRPRKLRMLLPLVAGAGIVVLAVCVLWKPSGANREGQRPDGRRPCFLVAAAESGLPAAAYSLLATGSATIAVTEGGIADLASAALDGGDLTVPPQLAASVRNHVPECVESVAGCSLSGKALTLYLKCRYLVSVYVTVCGYLTRGSDGSLLFDVTSAHVGLLPVPQRLLARALGPRQVVIVDPQASGVAVVGLSTGEGSLAVDIERISEGS